MLLDTLAIVHRHTFLEEAFNLVAPEDVRWLFISHEDRDHTGCLMQILDRCPNATLITSFIGLGKLGEEFSVPIDRVHMLNDGDTLDIGDRTVTAIRPPLYDSSATRGLWDPKNRIYYAADCFGIVSPESPQYTDEMNDTDFEEGYFWMNRVNHAWYEHVMPDALAESADSIKALDPAMIVSGHGPVESRDPGRMCDLIKQVSGMEPVHMPDHSEFVQMLEGNG